MYWNRDLMNMAVQQSKHQQKRGFKNPQWIYSGIAFLWLSTFLYAHPSSNPILGIVLNADTGDPVAYANVLVLNNKTGTITDSAGRFTLSLVESFPVRLRVSHIGFETANITITDSTRNPITIQLSETFFQMDRVVVTATRTPRIFRDVPVATEVITKQDIRDSGALNVGDLLNQRSGVNVTSSVDGGSVVNLLGMDSKYVLILQDGQPIAGKFNGRVALDQIPTSSLQKVEILKGPSSALYGSEAMGGVINLVSDTTQSWSTFEISSRYSEEGGDAFTPWEFQTGKHSAQVTWSINHRPVSFRLDGDYRRTNLDKSVLYIDMDEVVKSSLRGWLTWRSSPNIKLTIDNSWFQDQESSHSAAMNASTNVQRINSLIHLQTKIANQWVVDHSLRWANYSRIYAQVRPWGEVVRRDTTSEHALEYEVIGRRDRANSSLNLGLELSQEAYSSDRIMPSNRVEFTNSLFGQGEYQIFSNTTLVTGLRIDRNPDHTWVLSPRIGTMISIGQRWKVRSTLGSGYRRPTFMDRYIDWNHVQFGYQVIGNPDLRPERSLGFTASIEYYHPQEYRISMLGYVTRFEDMINDYAIRPGYLSYQNIDQVLFRGLEIQGRWTVSRNVLASWGLNWVDNRDVKTGELVPNTQPLTMDGRLSFRLWKNHLDGTLRIKWTAPYHPQEYVPDLGDFVTSPSSRAAFAIWNLTLTTHLLQGLDIHSGIDNLTDFVDNHYGPFVGRRIYLELRMKLQGSEK